MNDDLVPFAEEIAIALQARGFRIGRDFQADKLGAKIRRAETAKVPHMLVIGNREKEEGKVSLRSRIDPSAPSSLTVEEFTEWLSREVQSRRLPEFRK